MRHKFRGTCKWGLYERKPSAYIRRSDSWVNSNYSADLHGKDWLLGNGVWLGLWFRKSVRQVCLWVNSKSDMDTHAIPYKSTIIRLMASLFKNKYWNHTHVVIDTPHLKAYQQGKKSEWKEEFDNVLITCPLHRAALLEPLQKSLHHIMRGNNSLLT